MKRMELIANKSVEDEIITSLETHIDSFYYTTISIVHGRGKNAYHLGTSTWPEENCMIVSYVNDHDALVAKDVVREIKKQFPGEGIKLFFTKTED